MVHQTHGYYHYHTKRKKLRKEYKAFSYIFKKNIDKIIYIIVALGIVMTIPQVAKIWVEQNASSLSLVSWLTYIVTASFWLMYGLYHKVKLIVASSSAWIVLHALIILGIVLYG